MGRKARTGSRRRPASIDADAESAAGGDDGAGEADATKRPVGQIFTWGFCTHGQLGLKEKVLGAREYVDIPTHAGEGSALSDAEMKTAACGHFHTIVCDRRGNIYSFGRDERGQLGRGAENEEHEVLQKRGAVPRKLKSLASSIIVDVVCGAFHTLVLTSDRVMLSWGWNQHGQLGRPTAYQTDSTPGYVREAKDSAGPVKNFTAGFSFSAAVLIGGQLIAWGSNNFGQLGVGYHTVRHPDVAVTPLCVPSVIATQVAAGDGHMLVVSNHGEVFAAGDNSFGQLGLGAEDPEAAEERCGRLGLVGGLPGGDEESSERIEFVAAGGATSAAISTRGRLFTWGGGVWGQLGLGERADRDTPGLVPGIPRVKQVDIAQDHMLAVCVAARPLRRMPSPARAGGDLGNAGVADVDDSTSSSLWAWGRRQLIPRGLVEPFEEQDSQAQRTPCEVPHEMLGTLGMSCVKKGADMELQISCGGAHSIMLVVPAAKDELVRRYVAEWCPRLTTVCGQGTKGGRVSEGLPFVIVSRNQEGRDEKVGGLRFRVWASPASLKGPHALEKMTFDLQYLRDRRDGTYEGSYLMRRPGTYLLHVHMLPPQAEQNMMHEEGSSPGGAAGGGEPVSGSPFRITVDSGPAFAGHCILRLLRSGADAAKPVDSSASRFMVEASSEVVWEIQAYDVVGHASTLRSDRFAAHVVRVDEAVGANDARKSSSHAAGARSPGSPGAPAARSSAAAALRELARQRAEDRRWERMSSERGWNTHKEDRPKQQQLEVKAAKQAGKKEIRWTPAAVGQYQLSVNLLGVGESSDKGVPVKNSPFDVIVIAGKPHAANSELIVEGLTDTGKLPVVLQGETPHAEVSVRLLLRDRLGNICQLGSDPLKHVAVRVENIDLVNLRTGARTAVSSAPSATYPSRGGGTDQGNLLDWKIGPAQLGNGGLPGALLDLKLSASGPAFRSAVADACAAANAGDSYAIQLFVSATERASRQRLQGSPCRVRLGVEVPAPTLAPLPSLPVAEASGCGSNADADKTAGVEVDDTSSNAKVCATDAQEQPAPPPNGQLEPMTVADDVGALGVDTGITGVDTQHAKEQVTEVLGREIDRVLPTLEHSRGEVQTEPAHEVRLSQDAESPIDPMQRQCSHDAEVAEEQAIKVSSITKRNMSESVPTPEPQLVAAHPDSSSDVGCVADPVIKSSGGVEKEEDCTREEVIAIHTFQPPSPPAPVPPLSPTWSAVIAQRSPTCWPSPTSSTRIGTPVSGRLRVPLQTIDDCEPHEHQPPLASRPSSTGDVSRLAFAGKSMLDAAAVVVNAAETMASLCSSRAEYGIGVSTDSATSSVRSAHEGQTADALECSRALAAALQKTPVARSRPGSRGSSTTAASTPASRVTLFSSAGGSSGVPSPKQVPQKQEQELAPSAWLPSGTLGAHDGPRRQTNPMSSAEVPRRQTSVVLAASPKGDVSLQASAARRRRASAVQGAGALSLKSIAKPAVAPSPWPQLRPTTAAGGVGRTSRSSVSGASG